MDPDEMDRLVTASEWQSLHVELSDMSEDETTSARKWYRRTGRALARRIADRDWREHSRVVQLQLAIALSETPEEASRNCRWGHRCIWRDDEQAIGVCADRLIARGREWADDFVRLATSAAFRGEAKRGTAEVASLVSAVVVAQGLETPLTETYVAGWASLVSSAHTYWESEKKEAWHPLTLLTAREGKAEPAWHPTAELTLGDCLRATHSATAILGAALATPNTLGEWAPFAQEGWAVEPTIRSALQAGYLERSALLEPAFLALSRDDRPNNQRVISAVLRGLDPTPAEVAARFSLILHVLPTVHGSVTKALLEMALAANLDDDQLVDFGAIILARPEKAQKKALLAHLARTESGAREPLLAIAAESDDASFAGKAQALLGVDRRPEAGMTATALPTGLAAWSHSVSSLQPGHFEPYEANEAGLDQARSDEETWSRITTEAAILDAVVRFGHRDLTRLRETVAEAPDPSWYSNVRTPYLLHQWVKTGGARRDYTRTSTTYRYDGSPDPIVEHHSHQWLPPGHLVFTDRLVEESILRLGPLEGLLSTPSRADGTIAVGDLADRVRRARDTGYGPYDLVQALLRLDPTVPADAERFAGLRLPPADEGGGSRSWRKRRRTSPDPRDGAEVIRRWIEHGGWAGRNVDFPGAEPRTSELTLPLPTWLCTLDGIDEVRMPTGTGSDPRRAWGSDDPGPWLGVCPWDVEHLVAMIAGRFDQNSVFHAQRLPLIVWSAGPIGAATHHHIARLLAHPRLDSRLLTAQHAATLARQGRLDPELLRDRSVALFRHGSLSLGRAVHGWSELAALSSLSVVWPAWMATLDAACLAERKPAGLADLLRSTREHMPVVIEAAAGPSLPPAVHELAQNRGSSKAAIEARALVDSLAGGTPR